MSGLVRIAFAPSHAASARRSRAFAIVGPVAEHAQRAPVSWSREPAEDREADPARAPSSEEISAVAGCLERERSSTGLTPRGCAPERRSRRSHSPCSSGSFSSSRQRRSISSRRRRCAGSASRSSPVRDHSPELARVCDGTYDGDTPDRRAESCVRRETRSSPNADMLHQDLPYQARWGPSLQTSAMSS